MKESISRIPKEEMSPYQFLGDIYNYLDTHRQYTVPNWIDWQETGTEFYAINTIDYGYRYIDYSLIAEGAYNTNTSSSKMIFDRHETIYRQGIYKVVSKQSHPEFISFNKRKLIAPPELEVTLVEEIKKPDTLKPNKYLIAFFNKII